MPPGAIDTMAIEHRDGHIVAKQPLPTQLGRQTTDPMIPEPDVQRRRVAASLRR
jgi:hypothetical protein